MKGFNESERLLYKAVVFSNIIQSMLAILRAMKDFDLEYDDEEMEQAANRYFEQADWEYLCTSRWNEASRLFAHRVWMELVVNYLEKEKSLAKLVMNDLVIDLSRYLLDIQL